MDRCFGADCRNGSNLFWRISEESGKRHGIHIQCKLHQTFENNTSKLFRLLEYYYLLLSTNFNSKRMTSTSKPRKGYSISIW